MKGCLLAFLCSILNMKGNYAWYLSYIFSLNSIQQLIVGGQSSEQTISCKVAGFSAAQSNCLEVTIKCDSECPVCTDSQVNLNF